MSNGTPVARCSTCICYRPNPIDPKNIAGPKLGVCIRLPPTPILMVQQDAAGNIVHSLQSFSPPVPEGGFCYEHDDGSEAEDVEPS